MSLERTTNKIDSCKLVASIRENFFATKVSQTPCS